MSHRSPLTFHKTNLAKFHSQQPLDQWAEELACE